MKKMRKGFTLLELLVVIGVMGILGATGMVAGQEATNAARATTIADGLEKASAAMMMYYSDVAQGIADGTMTITATEVLAGAQAYLKDANSLENGTSTQTAGKYCVVLGSEESNAAKTWWVGYTFLETDGSLKAMIANKAKRMGLKATAATTGDEYTDGATVYMQVR